VGAGIFSPLKSNADDLIKSLSHNFTTLEPTVLLAHEVALEIHDLMGFILGARVALI